MFESLKKKFSDTANKLTKKVSKDAEIEDNIEYIDESEINNKDSIDSTEKKSFIDEKDKDKNIDKKNLSQSNKDSNFDEKDKDESNEISSQSNKNSNQSKHDSLENEEEKNDSENKKKSSLFSFFQEKTISEKDLEDILWELELSLLESDVAINVANVVVESIREDLTGKKIKRSQDIDDYTFEALQNGVSKIIDIPGMNMTELIEKKKAEGEPLVVMFVGINGTGKTTTIAKLSNYYMKKGYTPVVAASDTFRAGAIEQLTHHTDNLNIKIIKHQKGSDPAAVAFDAVQHAKAKEKELVLIDTAGRMQTNINLMDEMKKIKRVVKPDLIVFVGDALTGNDAVEQATKFNEAIDIDGVILTKADADSKGGASLSIGYVIGKPILFLGMGQGYDDIKEYDPEWMLGQIFS